MLHLLQVAHSVMFTVFSESLDAHHYLISEQTKKNNTPPTTRWQSLSLPSSQPMATTNFTFCFYRFACSQHQIISVTQVTPLCGRREKPCEVRVPREQVAWEWGAEVKPVSWALGSLTPVHKKPPRCLRGEGIGGEERVLQGESRVLAERPGIGKEVVGGHGVASLQVAWQFWAVHLRASSASYCQGSQTPVGSTSEQLVEELIVS